MISKCVLMSYTVCVKLNFHVHKLTSRSFLEADLVFWPEQTEYHRLLIKTRFNINHYNDVIMGPIASQITSHSIVYSIVYSDADQRKYHSSASLAFVRGIHRGPVNSPHKWPVTRKLFPFDDVIMDTAFQQQIQSLDQTWNCQRYPSPSWYRHTL